MPNNDYANEPNQSRSEEIIQSILDNTEYDEPARSRIEYLLIELKNAIEGGGGGGGVTSYSPLTEKPKIDNHTLQAGNNTSSDLGLQTKLTFDSAPTENSTNPVTSGGVYTALGSKANSEDVYNKSDVDTALSAKADKSNTYTKTEVDTALSSKQNTISDLSTIRSGAALGATAVQPVSGKGLSTNDYTTAEKEKLAGIEAQANKTTVDSALSGTSPNPVQNKVVKAALDAKQTTLTTAQLAAVNSGITSADVEQITTNENNIYSIAYTNPFTVYSDDSVELSGAGFIIPEGTAVDLPKGKYILSFTASTARTGTLVVDSGATEVYRSSINIVSGSNMHRFTISADCDTIRFVSSASITVTNLMIVSSLYYDSGRTEYIGETMTNAELTAKEQVNENNISWLVDTGVKNLLDYEKIKTFNTLFTWSGNTGTYNGVTVKIESNAVKISASNASETVHIYLSSEIDTWKNGNTYRLTGVPQASADNVNLNIQSGSPDYYAYYTKISNQEVTFPNVNTRIRFSIRSGATFSEVTIPLMMCSVAAYSASSAYQPYAMSNAELTAKVKPLEVQIISSALTEQAAESYADGTVCGYSDSFASLSGLWLVIRTYTLNADGNRKVQIVESNVGERKMRFFNGSWGSWT